MSRARIALVAVLLAPLSADAVPRGARARRPPRPTVELQIAGLQPGPSRRFSAVLHAIRRDAVPALRQCLAESPEARGVASVRLTPARRGRVDASVQGALPDALARCVREAATRVELPPEERFDDAADDSAAARGVEAEPEAVRFEVRVRLPAVGAR
ncbi:MAG: hypothetical protein R3A48_05120 [Polyangiales bacterium]